jgi:hypothetical protein
VLPEVCLRLPVELERVDAWLDDEAFFAPFRAHFAGSLQQDQSYQHAASRSLR